MIYSAGPRTYHSLCQTGSIGVISRWRGVRRSACPAACEDMEWWPRWGRFMMRWISAQVLSSELTHLMALISLVFGCETHLCGVPPGVRIRRWTAIFMPWTAVLFYLFFSAKLKLLLQEMQQSSSPISQSAAAFEGPPPYCGTGCLQFCSMLEPSGPLHDRSGRSLAPNAA